MSSRNTDRPSGLAASGDHQAHLGAVAQINEALWDGLGRDGVLGRVARHTRELLGVAASAVLTLEEGGNLLVRATDGALMRDLWGTWVSSRDTPEAEVLATQRPLAVVSHPQVHRCASPVAADGVRAALLVPVPGVGRTVGVVEAVHDDERRFTADDARTVGLFVAQVGLDVEQNVASATLTRLASAVTLGSESAPDVLDALVGDVVETGAAVSAALYLFGEDAAPRLAARRGRVPSRFPDDARAAAAGRCTVVGPATVCVPLVSRDTVLGVLSCQLRGQARPSPFQAAYLSLVAASAASVVEAASQSGRAAERAAWDERHRLARELHDSVSQTLYSIGLGARTVRELLDRDPSQARDPMDYMLELAESGLSELRALIFELRPEGLAEEGLVAALDKQIAAVGARHGLRTHADLGTEPQTTMDVKRALYRVALEALQNAARHAQAQLVTVRMQTTPRDVVLEVSDDGIGFDPDAPFPGHLGLASMRERIAGIGGDLHIASAPGQGTTVRVRAPLSRSP